MAAMLSHHEQHYHSLELTEREQMILRAVIQSYVLTANPVGSQNLVKALESDVKLSSATIRNVMADLEEMGYITHPHTSAGRIPTDKGYRLYVDSLMQLDSLTRSEERTVIANLSASAKESVLRDASKVLGSISKLLGVVQIPSVADLIVRKIELIALSSTRILIVVALDSDIVRTLTLEAAFEIDHTQLDEVARMVNERISGKALRYVHEHFPSMMSEIGNNALIRLFIDSVDQLFNRPEGERVHVAGTQYLLHQPEFDSPQRMRGVIELVENEEVIIHLLERSGENDKVQVTIGSELDNQMLQDYSLVSATYTIGSATCSVGLIGPKRMNYAKMVSLVGTVASALSTPRTE